MQFQDYIFDLYGTLVDIHTEEDTEEVWNEMIRIYGKLGADYEKEELRDSYKRVVDEMETGSLQLRKDAHEAHPEIEIDLVFQKLALEKGISITREEAAGIGTAFRKVSTLYLRLYPFAKELLKELRDGGAKVWLLSNAQAIFTRAEMGALGITDSFDGIYLSSDYQCKKPDEKFYRVLLDERGIVPENAIMIGNDSICDIAGARKLGLHTCYICSNLSPESERKNAARGVFPETDYCLEKMDLQMVLKLVR